MIAPDENSIWMVEEAMEAEFLRIVKGALPGVQCQRSRGTETAQTPYIDLVFEVGEANGHQKLLYSGQAKAFDVWQNSALRVSVNTNRGTQPEFHPVALGKMRGALQRFKLAGDWRGIADRPLFWQSPYHAVADIRETGTVYTSDPETAVDTSTITFNVLHNIKPDAWPAELLN